MNALVPASQIPQPPLSPDNPVNNMFMALVGANKPMQEEIGKAAEAFAALSKQITQEKEATTNRMALLEAQIEVTKLQLDIQKKAHDAEIQAKNKESQAQKEMIKELQSNFKLLATELKATRVALDELRVQFRGHSHDVQFEHWFGRKECSVQSAWTGPVRD